MIRLIQRRLIIPRGDTGTFTVPVLANVSGTGVAVFSIIDPMTQTLVFQKEAQVNGDKLEFELTHNETVNLPVGKYEWDIKYYIDPVYAENKVVNGQEVDSYYAAFGLPICEIKQTGDNLLTNSDSPSATLTPDQLNIITSALNDLTAALQQSNTNVTHYPTIIDKMWYVWDATADEYVNTGVRAEPLLNEYVRKEELEALTTQELQNIINNT